MELPPYHIPTLKGVLMHMWERTVLYLKKAGTIILGASILVWFLTAYPLDVEYSRDFDAAKDAVTDTMEQEQSQLLASYGLKNLKDNAELNSMYDSMVNAQKEADDAEDDEDQDVNSVAQAKEAEEDKPEYPDAFADLEASNPKAYAQALPLFNAKKNADDATADLEAQENAEKIGQSYAARLGKFIEPAIKPLGFDWKIGVGLIACTAAKEVMVSTLATIYSVQADDKHEANLVTYLAEDPDFNAAVALSLMVFCLLYMPCVAALAVIKRETNSWKWMGFSAGLGLVLAYVFALVTYNISLLAGLGA